MLEDEEEEEEEEQAMQQSGTNHANSKTAISEHRKLQQTKQWDL